MKRIAGVSWHELLSDEGHPMWERLPTLEGDRLRVHLDIALSSAATERLERLVAPAAILSLALPTFTEAVFSIANTAALGLLAFVSGSKTSAKESPARGAPFP